MEPFRSHIGEVYTLLTMFGLFEERVIKKHIAYTYELRNETVGLFVVNPRTQYHDFYITFTGDHYVIEVWDTRIDNWIEVCTPHVPQEVVQALFTFIITGD